MLETQMTRREALAVIGGTILAGMISNNSKTIASEPSESPTLPYPTGEITPAATPRKREIPSLVEINLPLEFQERASEEFMRGYEEFKFQYLIDAGDGALRTLHDPESENTSFEVQSIGEFLALYAGDFETAERMFQYDDRYRQPDGLTPWLIDRNGDIEDDTVVSPVMMFMAAARLLSPNEARKEEGREILESIKTSGIITPENLIQGFQGEWSNNLTNPAYWNTYFLELFGKVDPYWNDVAQSSRNLMDNVAQQIADGEIIYYPNWIDFEGKPTNGPLGEKPEINYDAAYIPFQQAHGALNSENMDVRNHASIQLFMANNFFYDVIKGRNSDFKINRLLDGYELDGTVKKGKRWAQTAFTSGAAVASIASSDEAYRDYMFNALVNIPFPAYPFNDYMKLFALLTLSGKMQELKP